MSKKILLVDSNNDHRRLYLSQLAASGYEVAAASSAQAALDALDEFAPDLLVTELLLPINNGLTILKEMITYEDWTQIPVVILSSVRQSDFGIDNDLWEKFNVIKYCYKPVCLPTDFAKTVAKIVT